MKALFVMNIQKSEDMKMNDREIILELKKILEVKELSSIIEHAKFLKKAIESLKRTTEMQCSKGNWDYSDYMMGMANGLILALAIMEDTDPEYLDAPEVWGVDKPLTLGTLGTVHDISQSETD